MSEGIAEKIKTEIFKDETTRNNAEFLFFFILPLPILVATYGDSTVAIDRSLIWVGIWEGIGVLVVSQRKINRLQERIEELQ